MSQRGDDSPSYSMLLAKLIMASANLAIDMAPFPGSARAIILVFHEHEEQSTVTLGFTGYEPGENDAWSPEPETAQVLHALQDAQDALDEIGNGHGYFRTPPMGDPKQG
jgi:hypothetical protein